MTKLISILWRELRPALGRARADERGVTAVEFGLLAFPFFAIIAGILQTSVIFLASQVLESAVSDASRQIRTGQMVEGQGIEPFRNKVCDGLYGLFADCAGLHIRVNPVSAGFRAATMTVPTDPDCIEDCEWTEEEAWVPGGGMQVVLVQVYYRYPVIIPFGPLGMANMADGSRLLGSATVFQNEPFS